MAAAMAGVGVVGDAVLKEGDDENNYYCRGSCVPLTQVCLPASQSVSVCLMIVDGNFVLKQYLRCAVASTLLAIVSSNNNHSSADCCPAATTCSSSATTATLPPNQTAIVLPPPPSSERLIIHRPLIVVGQQPNRMEAPERILSLLGGRLAGAESRRWIWAALQWSNQAHP